jgi:hypothetical protein
MPLEVHLAVLQAHARDDPASFAAPPGELEVDFVEHGEGPLRLSPRRVVDANAAQMHPGREALAEAEPDRVEVDVAVRGRAQMTRHGGRQPPGVRGDGADAEQHHREQRPPSDAPPAADPWRHRLDGCAGVHAGHLSIVSGGTASARRE